MNDKEIRLRCIEAAAKSPTPHSRGYAAGVQESAESWYLWINSQSAPELPSEEIPTAGAEVLF